MPPTDDERKGFILSRMRQDMVALRAVPLVSLNIKGEPASKANSRQLIQRHGKIIPIKSQKALRYVIDFKRQCRQQTALLDGDLEMWITIHYASRRPDLDESLILDAMQGLIYVNDRQIKRRHAYWALDQENPRAEIYLCLAEN